MNPLPTSSSPYPFPTFLLMAIPSQTPPGSDAPPPRRRIPYGLLKGQIWVSDDFDAPLPEQVINSFEGRA